MGLVNLTCCQCHSNIRCYVDFLWTNLNFDDLFYHKELAEALDDTVFVCHFCGMWSVFRYSPSGQHYTTEAGGDD